jgi:hypothetical protein
MYFVKCNNCGNLNEFRSEYQIFCSACNKKLRDNYPDWIRVNPDRSFDDFLKIVTINSDEIPLVTHQEKSFSIPKSVKAGLGVIISFIIFYSLGQIGSDALIKYFNKESTDKEVLEMKWAEKQYGSGMSVATPMELTKEELPLPDEIRILTDKADMYQSGTKGLKVMINCFIYKPDVGELSLEGAALGAVAEFSRQKGVSDLYYKQEGFDKGNVNGFIQKGEFKFKGIHCEFINTGFMSGLNLWNVLVTYQAHDEVGRIASQRIIESIDFK